MSFIMQNTPPHFIFVFIFCVKYGSARPFHLSSWAYVQNEAGRTALKYWEDNEKGFQSNYGDWHWEYNAFRVVLSLFVEGLTLFLSER